MRRWSRGSGSSDGIRPVRKSLFSWNIFKIPRTGCWLKSGVLSFSPWTPFTCNWFWQTSLWQWKNLLLVSPRVREPVLKRFESHHWVEGLMIYCMILVVSTGVNGRDVRAESCRWISTQIVAPLYPKCAISQAMQSQASINNESSTRPSKT